MLLLMRVSDRIVVFYVSRVSVYFHLLLEYMPTYMSSPASGVTQLMIIIVLCTSGIQDFAYQRAEGELINRIFNATSA